MLHTHTRTRTRTQSETPAHGPVNQPAVDANRSCSACVVCILVGERAQREVFTSDCVCAARDWAFCMRGHLWLSIYLSICQVKSIYRSIFYLSLSLAVFLFYRSIDRLVCCGSIMELYLCARTVRWFATLDGVRVHVKKCVCACVSCTSFRLEHIRSSDILFWHALLLVVCVCVCVCVYTSGLICLCARACVHQMFLLLFEDLTSWFEPRFENTHQPCLL